MTTAHPGNETLYRSEPGSIAHLKPREASTSRSRWIDRFLEQRIVGALTPWREGQLVVVMPDGNRHTFGPVGGAPAEINIHDSNFFRRAARNADIGIGESYMAGEWSSPNLTALISAFIRNRVHLNLDLQGAIGWPGRVFNWLLHALQRNTQEGSERNIHAHYDLGNDFYELFLDPTMAYSSGIYPSPSATLEEAQHHKYDMVCRKLELGPSDHLLEIGSGWGGLAMHCARTTGCKVTTITISRAQFDRVQERIEANGLADQVEVRYCDYRKLEGKFTKIVSIEMLEAVGEQYWDTFFSKLDGVLAPNGLALIQVICVPDQRFASYGPASDWIRKYVFPGGRLPSLFELQRSLRRATQLETLGVEEIGLHYAPTLKEWRERFFQNLETVKSMGFGDTFVRLWDFYLSSCEASFATQWNRNIHLLCGRPSSSMFCRPTGS